eukprot:360102-Chlamydomonas_euryale.AAC.2
MKAHKVSFAMLCCGMVALLGASERRIQGGGVKLEAWSPCLGRLNGRSKGKGGSWRHGHPAWCV